MVGLSEEAVEVAVIESSVEVGGGIYTPNQLKEIVNIEQILVLAKSLIDLTYNYSAKDLLSVVQESCVSLPGGKEWIERRI